MLLHKASLLTITTLASANACRPFHITWGFRFTLLRVCHYAVLRCRYDADMALENVSLCRYYAAMPQYFFPGGILTDIFGVVGGG